MYIYIYIYNHNNYNDKASRIDASASATADSRYGVYQHAWGRQTAESWNGSALAKPPDDGIPPMDFS